jgi:iron complex outermembrane receptor protein
VGELFGGVTRSVIAATDPCSNRGPAAQQTAAVRALCVATGVPAGNVFTAAVQPNNIFPADSGGNPALGAESSDTYTAGVVLTPSFIPRLFLSVDYFDISLKGAVAPLGGGLQNTLNLCYNIVQDAGSEFCRAVARNPQTGEINEPYAVSIRNANTGKLKTSGIDIAARYRLPVDFTFPGFSGTSSFDLGTNVTYLRAFTAVPVAALPTIQNKCAGSFGPTCGQPLPRWRAVSRLTWNLEDLSLSLRHRYVGKVTTDRYIVPLRQGSAATPSLSSIPYPVLKAQNYFDLSFNLNVTKNFEFFGGANNIFNKEPPVSTQGPNANTFSATYDVLGVEFFLGATARF